MKYTQSMTICRVTLIAESEKQKSNIGRGFDRVQCYNYLSKFWGEIPLKKANVIISDLYKEGLIERSFTNGIESESI